MVLHQCDVQHTAPPVVTLLIMNALWILTCRKELRRLNFLSFKFLALQCLVDASFQRISSHLAPGMSLNANRQRRGFGFVALIEKKTSLLPP